jgi:hypothetical protein
VGWGWVSSGAVGAERIERQKAHHFQGAELQAEGEWQPAPTLQDLHAQQRKELRDLQLKHSREMDQMTAKTRGLASMEERTRIMNKMFEEQDLEKQEMFARHQADVCSQFKVGCPKMELVKARSRRTVQHLDPK